MFGLMKRLGGRLRGPAPADRRSVERGQVVVIVALSLVVVVSMVGLVIDGGFAWGKQRDTQNGADATAEAGAVVLAQNVAGVSPAKTDADVLAAITTAADENEVALVSAYYTDDSGRLLRANGALAPEESLAAAVGDGTIPPGASGVRAVADQTFETFLMRVIGFEEMTATAPATAVAGYLTSTCPSAAGCGVLPITFPVTVLGCTGTNQPAPLPGPQYWQVSEDIYTIPLCQASPGNVGWLDWTPTAGGTSELIGAVTSPKNPALSWPGWYYITSTGNVNSQDLENAINAYSGQIAMIPQFDATCDAQPSGPGVSDCPEGHLGGNGSQQWYHLATMSAFQFCDDTIQQCVDAGLTQAAYIAGGNPECNTGNGGTSCLAGRFKIISKKGNVSAAPPPTGVGTGIVGIQLVK